MAEELVKLTNQNDELEEKVREIPKLRAQLKVSALVLAIWYVIVFFFFKKYHYPFMVILKGLPNHKLPAVYLL